MVQIIGEDNTRRAICFASEASREEDPRWYLSIPALTRIWFKRSHGGTWPVIMASRMATPSGPSRGIGTPFISNTSSSLMLDFFSQSTTFTPGPRIDSTVDWISWSSIPGETQRWYSSLRLVAQLFEPRAKSIVFVLFTSTWIYEKFDKTMRMSRNGNSKLEFTSWLIDLSINFSGLIVIIEFCWTNSLQNLIILRRIINYNYWLIYNYWFIFICVKIY